MMAQNARIKLSCEIADHIRSEFHIALSYADLFKTQKRNFWIKQFARRYNVSPRTIRDIYQRRTWVRHTSDARMGNAYSRRLGMDPFTLRWFDELPEFASSDSTLP